MTDRYVKCKLHEGRLILSGRGMGWIKDKNGWFRSVDPTKEGVRE